MIREINMRFALVVHITSVEILLYRKRTSKAKKVVPRPPPVPYKRAMAVPTQDQSSLSGSAQNEHSQVRLLVLIALKIM